MDRRTNAAANPTMPFADSQRVAHRKVCVLAGGLAVLGGVLGLAVHPALSLLAAVGGIWLILAPDKGNC